MINAVRKIRDYGESAGKLIWHRLPKIALYTVAIYALFLVSGGVIQAIDKKNIEQAAATDFLNYTSFTVQNAREGEDVTFTLCRDHKENYRIEGTRTIYVIPEGKTEAQKVFIYNKEITGVVDSGDCQSYYIRESEYHFEPGKYLVTLNVNFKVKYDIPKSVYTKSGIFTIYPQPDDSTDMNAQLNILQQQLDDQQRLLDQLIGAGAVREPASTSNSSEGSSPETVAPQPSNGGSVNTDPDRTPVRPRETREVCDPILDIFGLRIGQTNCRQEPV